MTPYDLVPIEWGSETLFIRPVDWDSDPSSNEDAIAVKYESSCPKCGNTITIDINNREIICEACNAKVDNPLYISDDELQQDIIQSSIDNPHESCEPDNGLVDDDGPGKIPNLEGAE